MLAVPVVGATATVLVAAALGTPLHEALGLTVLAGAAALAVGVIGALVLRALRRRPIATQTTVVTLTAIGAVAAGAITPGHQMFLSTRPASALVVVIMTAGTVGVLIARVLGEQVGGASRSLAASARRIGAGDLRTPVEPPPTEELAVLAHELEAMSMRLAESQAHEKAMEDSRRDLIAWVSHDLRTPIARIRAIAEGLEDGVLESDGAQDGYWVRLRQEIDRMAGLVDDLFQLSQINAGLLRLEPAAVMLGDLVSDVASACAVQAEAKGIELRVSVNANPELVLSVSHIERVLANLLDNAVRFTHEGVVGLEVTAGDAMASVTVQDACGGIPAEDFQHLFDVGWSRDRAGPRGEGAGLGLVIAKGIVEAHGGGITASNAGSGCRFVVELPAGAAALRRRSGSPRPTPS